MMWKTPDRFCIFFLKNVELASYHPNSCLILLFMDTAVNSNLDIYRLVSLKVQSVIQFNSIQFISLNMQ